MPMISSQNRPFTTTPTMPSAIAAMTRSKNSTIRDSDPTVQRRARRRSPLAPGWYSRL